MIGSPSSGSLWAGSQSQGDCRRFGGTEESSVWLGRSKQGQEVMRGGTERVGSEVTQALSG